MQRIRTHQRDWPLHRAATSRHIEQQELDGAEPYTLMKQAGLAVARLALALAPHARTVWIACGPGNNGGDGLEAALQLKAVGLDVQVALASSANPPADAANALARARIGGVPIATGFPATRVPDLAIDALLGLGTDREPTGSIARLIETLNDLPCPVLSVDVPSGLHVDTGQPLGDHCVRAHHTLTLLTIKPGLFTGQGRDFAQDVWFEPLGRASPPETRDAMLATAAPAKVWRAHAKHKGSFGDVAVVGGGLGMSGAALLAARAALGAGAGRVYLDLLAKTSLDCDPSRPELMFRPDWWRGPIDRLSASTVVCGCGGGDAVREALPRLLSHAGKLVLDADALNAIASDTMLQQLLAARHGRERATVLTPHPLEAARLLQITTAQVQADRLSAAQQLADQFACTVLLKGSGSVLASPGALPMINPTGSAALATAGTGDVLAGWLGGWWASSQTSAATAAREATWLHGRAGECSRVSPVQAAELIDAMREIVSREVR